MSNTTATMTIDALLTKVLANARLALTFTISSKAGGGMVVEFAGEDVPMLLHRHGELLLALEHLATQALGLEPEQHDQISFDAGGFKQQRARELRRAALEAVSQVRATGRAYHFQAMSSRERRLLHLELAGSGLRTASEGEPPRRHLVLYPGV